MTSLLQHSDWLNGRVPDAVRARLRQLVEVVGYLPYRQPLGVVTADAVLMAANRPFLDLLRASGDEVLGADWDDFMPGWSGRVGAGDAPGAAPRTRAFEEYLLARDGELVWASVVASPILTPGLPGEPDEALAGWTLFVTDQAPPERDSDERRRKEILELLLESPTEFVVQLDGKGCVRFLSPALRRALGMDGTPGPGQDLADAHGQTLGGSFAGEFRELLVVLARPPYRSQREMIMATPSGDRVVEWDFEALLADAGALTGVLGVGRDVTERKVAEESAKRRLSLEIMASAISTRFANCDRESARAAIDYALVEVGLRVGADRIGLYTLTPDAARVNGVRRWSRDSGKVDGGEASFGLEDFGWLRARLAERRPVAISSLKDLPAEAVAEREIFTRLGLASVLVVPITHDATLAGFLALDAFVDEAASQRGAGLWDEDDLHLLRLLADQLAGLLVWRADERNLRSVSDCFLAFGPDSAANLTEVCRAIAQILAADMVLYDRRRGADLETETGWNLPHDLPRVTKAAGRVCAGLLTMPKDQVQVISDLQASVYAYTSPIVRRYGLQTYVGFPVRLDGHVIATISCLFAANVNLRESQLELLRVLGRAAAVEEERRRAVEDRLLGLAQIEQTMERTVATLTGAMSTRDPYTAGHEERVALLALAIGRELGLGTDDLRLLRLAATVHDIGKIAVPAELLSKPTRLSDAELAIIRRHSEAGWELLEPACLPASVTDAVLQHHERLDGSGYPAGLCGEDIGEFARIIAVADVVEAMSSHRPYRSALGVEPALEKIEGGSGPRYDPQAAGACLRLFREGGFSFAT